jgi:hypothetical protein
VKSLGDELPAELLDEWRRLNLFLSANDNWSKFKIDELREWMTKT